MIIAPQVQAEIERLQNIVDGIGRGIDPGIMLLVATLRCHGFETTASCEGHADRLRYPWVHIQSPAAPELLKKMQDGPHSGPEFVANRKFVIGANRAENHRLFTLLEKFYASRSPSYQSLLTITEHGPGYGQLMPHAAYLIDESSYPGWLKEAQAEMQAFAEFLNEKLNSDVS